MQIKEVEEKTGLTKKAIRYYEENSLIKAERNDNRYKNYNEETVETLVKIKQLRLLNFSVNEIKQLLVNENCEGIIFAQLKENEQKLKRAVGIKQVLERMLNSEQIDLSSIEQQLLKEQGRTYMHTKNHLIVFGLLNLLSFIAIYIFFSINAHYFVSSNNILWFVVIQSLFVVGYSWYQQNRKKKVKAEGILLLEKKPLELTIHFFMNIFTYILSARMFIEGIYFAKKYVEWEMNYSGAIGNVFLALLMSSIGVLMLISSFFPDKQIEEFILKKDT